MGRREPAGTAESLHTRKPDDAVPPGPPGLVPSDGDLQDAAMEDERHDQGVPVRQMRYKGPCGLRRCDGGMRACESPTPEGCRALLR